MWWVLPWLLFAGCVAGVACTSLLWRRRHPDQPGDAGSLARDFRHLR